MSAVVLIWSLVGWPRSSWAWPWGAPRSASFAGRGRRTASSGLDTLYVNAMLLLLTFGIRSGSTLYFEAALVIALLGSSARSLWPSSCCAAR